MIKKLFENHTRNSLFETFAILMHLYINMTLGNGYK